MTVAIHHIKEAACAIYDMTDACIISHQRTPRTAHIRHLAWVACRELTKKSYASIGREFGFRDHSTVHHGVNVIHAKGCADDAHSIKAISELAVLKSDWITAVPFRTRGAEVQFKTSRATA